VGGGSVNSLSFRSFTGVACLLMDDAARSFFWLLLTAVADIFGVTLTVFVGVARDGVARPGVAREGVPPCSCRGPGVYEVLSTLPSPKISDDHFLALGRGEKGGGGGTEEGGGIGGGAIQKEGGGGGIALLSPPVSTQKVK